MLPLHGKTIGYTTTAIPVNSSNMLREVGDKNQRANNLLQGGTQAILNNVTIAQHSENLLKSSSYANTTKNQLCSGPYPVGGHTGGKSRRRNPRRTRSRTRKRGKKNTKYNCGCKRKNSHRRRHRRRKSYKKKRR